MPNPDSWHIADYREVLPYSDRIAIPVLLRTFDNTATSYKYLFFLSLLDLLEESAFDRLVFKLKDILLNMLAKAWYPHNYFRLSFGVNDRITRQLDALDLSVAKGTHIGPATTQKLKATIAKQRYTDNSLLTLVPYRLIAPFFASDLKGTKDTMRNSLICTLAQQRFETVRPFYRFTDDRKSIIMHHEWMLYFYENLQLVKSFISWSWLVYMQRRNPSAPNLQMKLFPPLSRESLAIQSSFYKTVLSQGGLRCMYSGERLVAHNFSLDHFLPWSFVAHDQLWNLVPVSPSINASKSDKLPSLDHYFAQFALMQHSALACYHDHPGIVPWRKVAEPYIVDLKLRPEDVLNRERLTKGLRSVIEPLYHLAASQGFEPGWVLTPTLSTPGPF